MINTPTNRPGLSYNNYSIFPLSQIGNSVKLYNPCTDAAHYNYESYKITDKIYPYGDFINIINLFKQCFVNTVYRASFKTEHLEISAIPKNIQAGKYNDFTARPGIFSSCVIFDGGNLDGCSEDSQ